MANKLLLTGSNGLIGRVIRPVLDRHYDVVTLDLGSHAAADFVGDVADYGIVTQAMKGIDTVVHLAAEKHDLPYEKLAAPNFTGTYNIFAAAHQAEVRKVIFASSVRIDDSKLLKHANPAYPNPSYSYNPEFIDETAQTPKRQFTEKDLPRPLSPYGLSKAYGELLGNTFADQTRGTAISVRFGAVQSSDNLPEIKGELNMFLRFSWLSQRDMINGVETILELNKTGHHPFYLVSNNERNLWLPDKLKSLGYKPQDNVESYAKELTSVFDNPTGKI